MEIKKIDDESYESISAYLDLILTMVDEIKDLYFISLNGQKYMVSHLENMIALVTDTKDGLTNYYLGTHGEGTECFGTKDFFYEITNQDLKEVNRTSVDSGELTRLSYLPPVGIFNRNIMELSQSLAEEEKGAITLSWDVTRTEDLEDAFRYCWTHNPDRIRLTMLKHILSKSYLKHQDYFMGIIRDDLYYRPLISIGGHTFGSRPNVYEVGTLINGMIDNGFDTNLPYDMVELLTNKNKIYNDVKEISKEYKKHVRGLN
ncbi:MAG: hypothetical protein J1F35_02365 [Erysipelotrichales bacterium]|nr:hypothetical protein [Erysipelotrichales bacterium]